MRNACAASRLCGTTSGSECGPAGTAARRGGPTDAPAGGGCSLHVFAEGEGAILPSARTLGTVVSLTQAIAGSPFGEELLPAQGTGADAAMRSPPPTGLAPCRSYRAKKRTASERVSRLLCLQCPPRPTTPLWALHCRTNTKRPEALLALIIPDPHRHTCNAQQGSSPIPACIPAQRLRTTNLLSPSPPVLPGSVADIFTLPLCGYPRVLPSQPYLTSRSLTRPTCPCHRTPLSPAAWPLARTPTTAPQAC